MGSRADDDDLQRFYTSWAWKREHLPDRDRFRRPYTYRLEAPAERTLTIKQARFQATGFASTVWDSSIVICKHLEQQQHRVRGKRCLDLSAGCGLAAIVMAHLGASSVVATDLAGNLDLLRDNCTANAAAGEVIVQEHSWGQHLQALLPAFDLVVACDVMYIAEAIPDLVRTLTAVCAPEGEVLVAHGRNRGGEAAFRDRVEADGVFVLEEVGGQQLHDVYRCNDVSVYRLKRKLEAAAAAAAAGRDERQLQRAEPEAEGTRDAVAEARAADEASRPQAPVQKQGVQQCAMGDQEASEAGVGPAGLAGEGERRSRGGAEEGRRTEDGGGGGGSGSSSRLWFIEVVCRW